MSPELVLASGNAGKIREIQALLAGTGLIVAPQAHFGVGEAEETGQSFLENALLKARHAACFASRPAIADDSGLEVDALDGAPGVYSARYAGLAATDAANNAKLLAALEGVPFARRTARFRCVLVFLSSGGDPTPLVAEGVWEGFILDTPRGTHGFGYDPLFFLPDHDCSSAELDPASKNRLSHRGQALAVLRPLLLARLAGSSTTR